MTRFPRLFFVTSLLLGCKVDSEDACIFDGRYEFGFVATNGCESVTEQLTFFDEESECDSTIDQVAFDGSRQLGIITCEPGDPVVECGGFASASNGCRWDLYFRRLAR